MILLTKMKISYLGPAGSFSHEAAAEEFPRAELLALPSLEEVFSTVTHGEADYGVLPLENSVEGVIGVTLHSLVEQRDPPSVMICGERYHEIIHVLAGVAHASLDMIEYVHTKAEPWGQCRDWVRTHLSPKVQFMAESSTSKAAEIVGKSSDSKRAAIVSPLAVRMYKLHPLVRGGIQKEGNTTRFVIVGKKLSRRKSVSNKVTLALALHDRIGAIADVFGIMKAHRTDVRAVKVLPLHAPGLFEWRDWFFVDLLTSTDHSNINRAVEEMRDSRDLVLQLRELGRYPSGQASHDGNRGSSTRTPRAPVAAPTSSHSINDLIAAGEGTQLEFKSSLRWNRREGKRDAIIEFATLRTVAAFMNARGGTLLIGIDDSGTPLGLEDDYKTLHKQSRDGLELFLRDVFHNSFGASGGHLIDIRIEDRGGKDICVVLVRPSPTPAWLEREGKHEFFLRSGNQTRLLDSKDAAEYVKLRWG